MDYFKLRFSRNLVFCSISNNLRSRCEVYDYSVLVSGESRKPNASEKEDKMSLAEMKAAIAGEWRSCVVAYFLYDKIGKNIFVCHEECENEYRICTVVVIKTVVLSRLCSAFYLILALTS